MSTSTKMRRRCKVLVHAVAGGYGGAERTMECLVHYLADHNELVFFAENELYIGKLEALAKNHSIEIVRSPRGRSLLNLILVFWRTALLCWKRDFDVVVTNTNKSALVMALVRLLFPLRMGLVVFIRDFQWAHARTIFWLLGDLPVFVGPSEAISDHWPDSYGKMKSAESYGAQRLSILPSPFKPQRGSLLILPDCYERGLEDSNAVRTERWFLILGTVNRWKGIDLAIEAISRFGDDFPDVGLRIVGREGDPGLVEELVSLAHARGVSRRVTFEPHVDGVDAVVASSLCIISASVPWNGGPETFGRTVVEAWAWKRPVISSDCGGPRYLITDGDDGFLFKAGDAKSLEIAMRKLLSEPELAIAMGEKGYLKFSQQYTSRAVAKGFQKLVDQAIEQVER